MKRVGIIHLIVAIAGLMVFSSCKKDPIDDRGLLISDRQECYISLFELLGSDNRTVLVAGSTKIDTTNLKVDAVARFGTNLTRVKPYCSVVTDAIVEPNMGAWTDFTQPHQYTVVSGNRLIRKTYTISVTVQR